MKNNLNFLQLKVNKRTCCEGEAVVAAFAKYCNVKQLNEIKIA